MRRQIKDKDHISDINEFLIRPGMNVVCALRIDEENGEIDTRTAMIYDSIKDEIIMSQTNPSLYPEWVGKRIEVTYLRDDYVRVGLSANIHKIIDDYQLSSSNTVQAIILNEFSHIKNYNLRFAHRVTPIKECHIYLFMPGGQNFDIMDISVSGVKFAVPKSIKFKRNEVIRLQIKVNNEFYNISVRIVRQETNKVYDEKDVTFIGAQFINITEHLGHRLFKIIREIERKTAFSHKFERYF
ncbi:MAG: PilZ domain-containing protein [bacterium]